MIVPCVCVCVLCAILGVVPVIKTGRGRRPFMAHLIPIPSFDGNGFEAYERDVGLWCNATEVPKEKQALVLMLRLTGRPAALAKAEPLTAYSKDSGVGNLLDFLRKKFGQSPIHLIHQDLKAFFGIRRTEASVTEFLDRFQMSRSQVETRLGKSLGEEVACSILLEACALNPQDKRNALAAVSNFKDSAKLLAAIQHLFSGDRDRDGSALVADHDTYGSRREAGSSLSPAPIPQVSDPFSETSEDEASVQEAFAVYNAMRNRVRRKNAQRPSPEPSSEPGSNPVDRRTGNRLRCWLCGSRDHPHPKCPKKPEHSTGREWKITQFMHRTKICGSMFSLPLPSDM